MPRRDTTTDTQRYEALTRTVTTVGLLRRGSLGRRRRRRSSGAVPTTGKAEASKAAVGLRFTAAAQAAGVELRVTAHSGRVGLASELTSRGASTTDVMLAGYRRTRSTIHDYPRWGAPSWIDDNRRVAFERHAEREHILIEVGR